MPMKQQIPFIPVPFILLSILLLSSCLGEQENQIDYFLVNESEVDLEFGRYSGSAGAWDKNFSDTVEVRTLPAGEQLHVSYRSKGGLATPFQASDSLVFSSGDSLRVVYTPMSEGKNPFWPSWYQGGYLSDHNDVVYHEYFYDIFRSDFDEN